MSTSKIGFEMERVTLSLDAILPIRTIQHPERNISRYKAIRTSIKEIGLVEPLIVCRQKSSGDTYVLVDGHLRLYALKELGVDKVECLVSTDDESFTYNARISRLSPIQEHKMIMKAISDGVTPERIASALNLQLKAIRLSMRLLDGLHPETIDLLKDKEISTHSVQALKKVAAVRQVEMAQLMVSTNIFSKSYVDALIMGTPKDQLVKQKKPKTASMSPEEIAQLEQEMETLHRDFKSIEASYGENMLNLTVARGYVRKLFENARVLRYLQSRYRDLYDEFEILVATEVL